MTHINPVNITIISFNNSTTEYYSQFFNIKQYDNVLHLDKRAFNLEKISNFQPHIILIDDYFNCENNKKEIEKIKNRFTNTHIYHIAPQCIDCVNEYNNILNRDIKDNLNSNLIEHFNKVLLHYRIEKEIDKKIAI